FVGEQRRGEVEGVEAGDRREFHHIEADDAALARHGFEQAERLVPAEAAGHRRACSGQYRGIDAVDVDGKKDFLWKAFRNFYFRNAFWNNFKSIKCTYLVLLALFPLFLAERAVAELDQGNPRLHDAAHDARVAVFLAFVGIAQVGMRVDLHDAEVLHAGVEVALDDAPGDGVLAAEHDGHFFQFQYFSYTTRNFLNNPLR